MNNINTTYNTCRDKLLMPEYGRYVQQMVDYALTLEDKHKRQRCAETIIEIMAQQQIEHSEQSDFYHKLWNHLARIANYELEIDYPVEIVAKEVVRRHPSPMAYPMQSIRHRHYGYLIERSLQQALSLEDEEQRTEYLSRLANQMKQSLGWWNADSMDNELVASDIERYTNNRLSLNLNEFKFAPVSTHNLSMFNLKKNERNRNKKKKH